MNVWISEKKMKSKIYRKQALRWQMTFIQQQIKKTTTKFCFSKIENKKACKGKKVDSNLEEQWILIANTYFHLHRIEKQK